MVPCVGVLLKVFFFIQLKSVLEILFPGNNGVFAVVFRGQGNEHAPIKHLYSGTVFKQIITNYTEECYKADAGENVYLATHSYFKRRTFKNHSSDKYMIKYM